MTAPTVDTTSLDWLDKVLDVMEWQGISKEAVVGVLREPTAWARETTRQDVGVAWKLRRGDIVVTVGLANPEEPLVLHVRRRRFQDEHKVQPGRSGNAGVHWPRSNRELKKMVVALGFQIRTTKNGRGHDDIIDPTTGYRVAQIACTPSDQNSYEATYRAALNYRRTTEVVG